MHSIHFIQDLAIVMMVAGFVTLLFRRFNQPVVLGYILAGLIIGPYTPPFALVTNEAAITTMAEVGIIFLMFSLGLHFNLRRLHAVGKTALHAASIEIFFMTAVGYAVGKLFGWTTIDCLFLGAIVAISSTTIVVRALHDMGFSGHKFSELIFGILVVEDILGVAVMALLSAIALTNEITVMEFVDTIGRLLIYLGVITVVGLTVISPVFRYVSSFKSNEGTLVVALGLCFSSAFLAMTLGYSSGLGAFLMGAIISETKGIDKIDHIIEPLRDMFSALFFVSVGMMINPATIAQHIWPILILTLIVIIGKSAACTLGTRLAGNSWTTSVRVGVSLTQIGEFSFVIATLGDALDVTSPFLYPIAVAVSAITTWTTPYLIRHSERIAHIFFPQKATGS